MIERRYLLLYTYKAFIYVSIISVIYIFTAGLFTSDETTETPQISFSLKSLDNHSHTYFKTDRRELLVIKQNNSYSVFWANDPIYGCRLEYKEASIQPVCIDIKYNLNGYSADKKQQLRSPDYKISLSNELVIY